MVYNQGSRGQSGGPPCAVTALRLSIEVTPVRRGAKQRQKTVDGSGGRLTGLEDRELVAVPRINALLVDVEHNHLDVLSRVRPASESTASQKSVSALQTASGWEFTFAFNASIAMVGPPTYPAPASREACD